MNHIYFFTGEDRSALEQYTAQWKEKFVQKHSREQLYEFDVTAEDFTLSSFLPVLQQQGIFSMRQLIILKGFPLSPSTQGKACLDEQEEEILFQAITTVPEGAIITLINPQPDRRKKKTMFFLDNAQVKIFPWDDDIRLKRIVEGAQGGIVASHVRQFAHLFSSESTTLAQQLQQVNSYFGDRMWDKGGITNLLGESLDESTFKLFEYIKNGQMKDAEYLLWSLVGKGEDIFKLTGLFIWYGELLFWAYHGRKREMSKNEVAHSIGAKPFSLEGPWQWVTTWTEKDVLGMMQALTGLDHGLKNSQFTQDLESKEGTTALLLETLLKMKG